MFDLQPLHNKEDFDNFCTKYKFISTRPPPSFPAWIIVHIHTLEETRNEEGVTASYEFIYFNPMDILKEFNIELGVYN